MLTFTKIYLNSYEENTWSFCENSFLISMSIRDLLSLKSINSLLTTLHSRGWWVNTFIQYSWKQDSKSS